MTGAEPTRLQHPVDKMAVFLLSLGALLRIGQYLAGASLWGDELVLVRNLTSKDLLTLLTHPLSNAQVAPPGFVLLLKLLVTMIGTSEYSLRLIPLLASLLALPLFSSLARKLLPREALLLALAAFSTSIPLIRYAAQVKPYSSDVAASLLCLLVARSWIAAKTPRTSLWAAATGVIVIWFSYTAVFTLAAVALLVLGRTIIRWSNAPVKHVVAVLAVWLVSAATLATIEHHRLSPETHSFIQRFWAEWMLPTELTLPHLGTWFVRLAQDFLSGFLHLPRWPAWCALLFIGTGYLYRRTSDTALLLGPLLITFLASAVRFYPFSGRVILFLVPNVLLLLTAGVLAVTSTAERLRLPRWGPKAMFLGAALAICVRPLWKLPPPYRDSETKPILSYLGEHRRNGDSIYVHQMAWAAYEFYGPRFSLAMDQAKISSLRGNLSLGPGAHPLEIAEDLDEFRGRRRLWVVFGGGYPEEFTAAISYLDAIGHRLDCRSSYNAGVYLYDLSDPQRLRSVKAGDFLADTRQPKGCESR